MSLGPVKKFSGKRLRECREAAGLSRMRLFMKTEHAVGPETIARYENGLTTPEVNIALILAKALGVPPGDLTE